MGSLPARTPALAALVGGGLVSLVHLLVEALSELGEHVLVPAHVAPLEGLIVPADLALETCRGHADDEVLRARLQDPGAHARADLRPVEAVLVARDVVRLDRAFHAVGLLDGETL